MKIAIKNKSVTVYTSSVALAFLTLSAHADNNRVAANIDQGTTINEETRVTGYNNYMASTDPTPITTVSIYATDNKHQIVNITPETSPNTIRAYPPYTVANLISNSVNTSNNHIITEIYAEDDNVNISDDGEHNYGISLKKDLTYLNSINLTADSGDTTAISNNGMTIKYYDNDNSTEYTTVYGAKGVIIKTNDGDADNEEIVSLTIDGLNNGHKRIINVKKGVDGTDAVNVKQLNDNITSVKTEINRHIADTDKRIDRLDHDIRKNRKYADAGTASVAAMTNIPQVFLAGASGLGVGLGHKHGQTAIAVGYSSASDNAKHIIKLSSSLDSQRDVTVGAGYLYQW